jgi:hypothetical protein
VNIHEAFASAVRAYAAELNAALKKAGFGVQRARIVDVSGQCPGFVTIPAFRGRGVIDRPRTLAKVIREREAEIARRAAATERPV